MLGLPCQETEPELVDLIRVILGARCIELGNACLCSLCGSLVSMCLGPTSHDEQQIMRIHGPHV